MWQVDLEKAPVWEAVLVYLPDAPPTKSSKTKVHRAVKFENGKWGLSSTLGENGAGEMRFTPAAWMPLPPPPERLQGEG